eukprot:624540-Pyramimonas_sp.AAC.1
MPKSRHWGRSFRAQQCPVPLFRARSGGARHSTVASRPTRGLLPAVACAGSRQRGFIGAAAVAAKGAPAGEP